jgi:peptide/nickel transport system substrate-binding protein
VRTAAGLIALALVLSACSGSGASSGGGGPKQGGELRMGTDSGIDSTNPYVAENTDSWTTFEYIYPELVQYGAKLQIVPDFASSWSTSPDGTTWTFHTRPNAHWSDGKPLTAEDAAWTIQTDLKYANGATAAFAATLAHLQTATAPDSTTLVLHYARPVANVLAQLQQLVILPEHVWSQYAVHGGSGLKTFQNPAPTVSGGPFILTEFKKNDIALFKPNPEWWGTKPHIDGFGLQMFSDDDAMITALKTHQLDAVELVPPTSVATVRSAGFVVAQSAGIQTTYLSINSNPKKPQHRELLNPLVREAFDAATDRASIDKVAYLGYAQPAGSIIAPATGAWHDPALTPTPFDIAKANQLLDQAGYKMGSNGIRVADGHPMSYKVIFPGWFKGAGDRIFDTLQSDYRQIGVQLIQQNMDGDAAFTAITAPNNKYLNFDLALGWWQPYVDPDFQLSVFICSQYGGWSDSGYCNPTYDRMYEQQGTLMNLAQRRALVWQMQALLAKDLPYIDINYPDWVEAHSPSWTGFVMTPQGSFNEMSDLTMLQVHQT